MTSPLSLMMPCLPGTSRRARRRHSSEAQKQIDAALEDIGTVHFAPLPDARPLAGQPCNRN